MKALAATLRRVAGQLAPHREATPDDWVGELASPEKGDEPEVRESCERSFDALMVRLTAGDVKGLLAEEARSAGIESRRGMSSLGPSRAIRVLNRCLVRHVLAVEADREAVAETLERLEARRFGKTKAPRKSLAETDTTPKSRYISAPVRRAVEARDGGRCTYEDKPGRRCAKRHDLEFHHRRPFSRGGEHSPEVLCLMCRTHNALMAEQAYGKGVMARYRRGASRANH